MATKLERDQKTLARFVEVYCHGNHSADQRSTVDLKSHDVTALAGRPIELCPDCSKLLNHALVKREHCPMDPKPQCKDCPDHCYQPTYREKIRQVMRYSGPRLLLRGRLDYLAHLLF